MTAPSKLDEARLRELIGDAVFSACSEYSDVKAARIKDLPFHRRCIVSNATDAIWDALSAERERGDRAVRAFDEAVSLSWQRFAIVRDMREALIWALAEIDGETKYENDTQRQNCRDKADEIILATQKAEGS